MINRFKDFGIKVFKINFQAIAYCGPLNIAKDPCSELEIGNYEYRYQSDQSPSLECPKGYVPNSCNIYSPWMELVTSQTRLAGYM